MLRFLSSFLCFIAFVSFGDAAGNTSTAALDALVQRQLPFHSDQFVFTVEPQVKVNMKNNSTLDTFTLSDGSDGKINIECSTLSACARGLYTYVYLFDPIDRRYLTEIGKVDIYWTGSRLSQISQTLPPVGKNISREAVVPWRYHFNTGLT
jgi:alpha-N-acetylglucosaminidase